MISGSVRSFSSDWAGKELTYGVYGPGMAFGEMSLDGGSRSASVITVEPSECALIDHDTIRKQLAVSPDFALALVELVISRAREATKSAKQLALLDVYGRLRSFLNTMHASRAASAGPAHSLKKLSQKDIASHIGSSREMVSRLFRDLENGGYIEVKKSQVTVKKTLPERW